MPELHLKDPIVGNYSTSGPFTKHKQRIQKFIETVNTNYIYKNELGKACFQHDTAYEDFKDFKRRTYGDKDKAFKIDSDLNYDGYQRALGSMAYRFLTRKQKELV